MEHRLIINNDIPGISVNGIRNSTMFLAADNINTSFFATLWTS